MFEYNHYIPILKGKEGEFGALANLPKEIKRKITPLIDIPPISFMNSKDVKGIDTLTNKMITSWGVKDPFFVDVSIKSGRRNAHDIHPITYIFNCIKNKFFSFDPIPTTGIIRDDAYNDAIKEIIQKNNSDICIRLLDDDMISIDELSDDVENLLNDLKIDHKKVHLLLDLRAITEENIHDVAKTTTNVINNISGITKWKTLTLAASGLPAVVGKKNKIVRIPRVEFFLWKLIISNSKQLARVPSYGDYGIVHPNHIELDSKSTPHPSPKIRYTLDEEWLVLKGQSKGKTPTTIIPYATQYRDLSKKLIELPEFMKGSFSKGDKDIENYASEKISSGSLKKWIEIDTIHHVTLVSNQIANTVVL